MDVKQMHIEVKQRLQKVSTASKEKFFAPEIDLALNNGQDRFINSKLNNEVQDKQLDVSFVNSLIVKNKELRAFKPATTDSNYEERMVYALTPPDYRFLLNDRSKVITNTCDPIGNRLLEDKTEYSAVLPFPDPSTPPYYKRVRITVDGVSKFDKTYNSTISDKQYKFHIVNDILENINSDHSDFDFYYENFRETFYKDSFIFVSDTLNTGNVVIEVYESNATTIDDSTTVAISGTTYKKYKDSFKEKIASSITKVVGNKSTESEYLYSINSTNKFYGPKHYEPLSSEANGVLYIYEHENSIITNCYIDYIRNPRQISLDLNQSCELPGSSHDKIVNLAVEALKLDIQDPTYSATLQQTETRYQQ